jgi:hypothetical protein
MWVEKQEDFILITLQHSAMTAFAVARKVRDAHERAEVFEKEIPWVLLPDGIRAYTGARQTSHFEKTDNGLDGAWMIFPDAKTLKVLTKENAGELVKVYMPAGGYKPAVIGEQTDVNKFDVKNYGHEHFHALRCHMLQDAILDDVVRERLIDARGRFENRFPALHNSTIVLDGQELRKQIALFEQLGFIHLLGKIYEATGMVLDRDWFNYHVYEALLKVYPADLADNTYKYMSISDELNQRIKEHRFELTKEEIDSVYITDDLLGVLDEMYAVAYYNTFREF